MVIIVFIATTGLFILIDEPFIGLVLTIVYVGAITVFFLFCVMMFGSALEHSASLKKTSSMILLFIPSLSFLVALGFAYVSAQDAVLDLTHYQVTTLSNLARQLYTDYGLVLQLVGLILFAVIIGSIMIAHTHRQTHKTQSISLQVKPTNSVKLYNPLITKGLKHD